CAYCDADLTATYEAWLTMTIDYVIPASVCTSMNIPEDWCWDYSNAVLACAACNGFCNQYMPGNIGAALTLEDFYDIRDSIFSERKELILAKHEEERRFFNSRPWEQRAAKMG